MTIILFSLNKTAEDTSLCRWYLVPRVLRNVSTVDLSVSVLGEKLSMPICVAATAMQRMAHPDGETATAKGTKKKFGFFVSITMHLECFIKVSKYLQLVCWYFLKTI